MPNNLSTSFRLVVLSGLVLLSGCTTAPDESVANTVLPPAAAETSGLVCLGEDFLSISDSGNPAELHRLDRQLRLRRLELPQPNTDWEALAYDGKVLYIADTGNNAGQRSTVQIHRLRYLEARHSGEPLPSLNLTYADYPYSPASPPVLYNHPYDAEALAYAEGQLYLFSKDWQHGISRVYQLDPAAEQQTLTPVAEIKGLPGLVTDAVYLPARGLFLLTGYQNFRTNPFPFMFSDAFGAFVAVLDRQFQLQTSISLPEVGQLEGICQRGPEVWLSQEQSKGQPARLWRDSRVEAMLDKL